MSISVLLMVVACILAFLAAFGVPTSRLGLFPLAFAFYVLAHLVGGYALR